MHRYRILEIINNGLHRSQKKKQICAELKISRGTLYNKMKSSLNEPGFSQGEEKVIASILNVPLSEIYTTNRNDNRQTTAFAATAQQ